MTKLALLLFCFLFCFLFVSNQVLAQKPVVKPNAAEAVKLFYKFYFSHNLSFDDKGISQIERFLTSELTRRFYSEVKRQTEYEKTNPTDKPYFVGLSFVPIEFCENDYLIGKARINGKTAKVKVKFNYGKQFCQTDPGTPFFYTISLTKIGGNWLIDDVIYNDGSTLTKAFENASKIKP